MAFTRIRSTLSHLTTKIFEHPFNRQLNEGSLPREAFTLFLEQDFLYLKDYSKALHIISKRLDKNHAEKFYRFATSTSADNLHRNYLAHPHSPRLFHAKKIRHEKIPVIADYTTHILTHAAYSPIAEAIASVTPCYWIYSELGQKMRVSPDNPYNCWITSISHPDFIISARIMVNILEELMENNRGKEDEIITAFMRSTEYELGFFDSVYDETSIYDKRIITALR